ncbi:MAG: glycerophosphodiester phosphodiesterase [Promethearchaeota archaeon]
MVMIIAHRGFRSAWPENTMLAFSKAIETGADGIEMDVHLSADGKAVVMHDGAVNRTTNGTGKIPELSYDDYICTLDAGMGEKVPLLEQVVKLCKEHDTFLNIEIKSDGLVNIVSNLLKKMKYIDGIIVSSFNHQILKEFKETEPTIKTAALVPTKVWSFAKKIISKVANSAQEDLLDLALKVEADAINPFFGTCTPKFLKASKENGLDVYPWTVDAARIARKLASWEATGIITNAPDKLLALKL